MQGKPRLLTVTLDTKGLATFCRHVRPDDEGAVEVGQKVSCLSDQIRPKVKQVVLVDPHRFAIVSRSKKKTARHDAAVLARFLKVG